MQIMIVEDDITIRSELYDLLINAGYSVVMLEDFTNSKEEILKSNSDLILLDINIPFINGEILLKEIRKKSNVPVIMVTSRVNEVDEVLSITNGADDYITKPYNPTILLLRIQNIFKRLETKLDIIKYESLSIDINRGIIFNGKIKEELTKNEMLIFSYMLNNKGVLITRDELMTILWNNKEYINDNALTVNISRLRGKLSIFGYGNKIETKKGQGYILL